MCVCVRTNFVFPQKSFRNLDNGSRIAQGSTLQSCSSVLPPSKEEEEEEEGKKDEKTEFETGQDKVFHSALAHKSGPTQQRMEGFPLRSLVLLYLGSAPPLASLACLCRWGLVDVALYFPVPPLSLLSSRFTTRPSRPAAL